MTHVLRFTDDPDGMTQTYGFPEAADRRGHLVLGFANTLTKGNALRLLACLDSQPLRLLLVSFAALTQILMIFRLFRATLGP